MFKNKTAFVTGGTSGIGKAICERFVKEGAKVMAVDLAPKRLKTSTNLRFIKVNVAKEAEVKRALAYTKRIFGKIDIVVNNAGIWSTSPLSKLTEKEVDRTFAVNTKGVLWGMKHALPYLRKAKGVILNTASIAGMRAGADWTAYDISKAAVISATEGIAIEYGKYGIRVNAIAPGAIATPLVLKEKELKTPPKDKWIKALPLPRYGKPEEVASLAAFLCSDEASYITGSIYVIDGGAMAAGFND